MGFLGGDLNLYRYVLSNPINFIDPLGLKMRDILEAYAWIVEHHPEITEGTQPAFFEADLPPDYYGLTIPHGFLHPGIPSVDVIWIDPNYESKSWLTHYVAHELGHAQKGFWPNLIEDVMSGGWSHKELDNRAAGITREYEEWLGQQSQIGECKK